MPADAPSGDVGRVDTTFCRPWVALERYRVLSYYIILCIDVIGQEVVLTLGLGGCCPPVPATLFGGSAWDLIVEPGDRSLLFVGTVLLVGLGHPVCAEGGDLP